mmetsp:Transcript_6257/g.16127  ORF Transcript_6257/g.16127 Transcript_6257/m.16127 type:complete len:261 (+) Transcript_6257:188-970(+)
MACHLAKPGTPQCACAPLTAGWRPRQRPVRGARRMAAVDVRAGLELYGSQGSRSPLVNWYLHEIRAPFEMKAPRDPTNPHPFGQVPALRDDGGVEMFESGAILAYLADAYGGLDTPQKRAAVQPWLVWANASLDPCIFVENARGQVLDTGARGKPGEVRALDRLNAILEDRQWLVNDEFSAADVAVGAYLLYVPQFFGDVNMGKWPNIARYMLACTERPAYGQAYEREVGALQARCQQFVESAAGGGDADAEKKKRFGIF